MQEEIKKIKEKQERILKTFPKTERSCINGKHCYFPRNPIPNARTRKNKIKLIKERQKAILGKQKV